MSGIERALRRYPVNVWQWVIFVAGMALRLLSIVREGWIPIQRAESILIAMSIAEKGTFANAYGYDSGPSAHCMPLYPLWQALLIRLFGTGPEARYAIAFFSSAASCLAFALFPRLSERAGTGVYAGVVAGLLGACLPFNLFVQADGGFETSFAFLAIILLLLLWLKISASGDLGWRHAVLLGLATGAAGLLSVVLLPVMGAWLLLPMASRDLPAGRRKHWLGFAILSCAVAGAVFAPWVIRNKLVLGTPLLTRSNFGLLVYQNNNDMARPTAEMVVYMPEFQALGPYGSSAERAKVRAMGEVAYNSEKLKLAEAWIRYHPRRFLVLTLEKIWYFWFPAKLRPWQTAGEVLVTLLGLWGTMFWGMRGPGRNLALLSLVTMAVYPLVYYVTLVGARYRFPVEGLLIFWLGVWLASVGGRMNEAKSRRAPI